MHDCASILDSNVMVPMMLRILHIHSVEALVPHIFTHNNDSVYA